jgi:hypothetical protein
MKRMCILFGCLMSLMIGVSGAAFAEDLLVGTAYFLDQSGEVFVPHGGERRLGHDLPVILLIETDFADDEAEGSAVIYYRRGDEDRIEEGRIRQIEYDFHMPISNFEIEAPELGRVRFAFSGEVMADEIFAEMCSYRVTASGNWYTAVGVMALEEFQETEEGREGFQEIVEDLREDIRDGREQ